MAYCKINQDGTLSSCSKPKEGFTELTTFQTKSDGSLFKYYNQDKTGNVAKEILETHKDENKVIYAELDLIDLKSIRAIRDNDIVYIDSLKNQALALRAKLNVITEGN